MLPVGRGLCTLWPVREYELRTRLTVTRLLLVVENATDMQKHIRTCDCMAAQYKDDDRREWVGVAIYLANNAPLRHRFRDPSSCPSLDNGRSYQKLSVSTPICHFAGHSCLADPWSSKRTKLSSRPNAIHNYPASRTSALSN